MDQRNFFLLMHYVKSILYGLNIVKYVRYPVLSMSVWPLLRTGEGRGRANHGIISSKLSYANSSSNKISCFPFSPHRLNIPILFLLAGNVATIADQLDMQARMIDVGSLWSIGTNFHVTLPIVLGPTLFSSWLQSSNEHTILQWL